MPGCTKTEIPDIGLFFDKSGIYCRGAKYTGGIQRGARGNRKKERGREYLI
jgi:hypothetical protein